MVNRRSDAFRVLRVLARFIVALLDLVLVAFAAWNVYMLATVEYGGADEYIAIRGALSLTVTFSIVTYIRIERMGRGR